MLSARRLRALAAAVAALAVPPRRRPQAAPAPFGHACTTRTACASARRPTSPRASPSFDGTPLDVDVTLPPTGDGPFPTILLLHGLGGTRRLRGHGGDPRYNNVALRAAGLRGRHPDRARVRQLVRRARVAHGRLRERAGPAWTTCATRSATSSRSSACSSTRASRTATRSASTGISYGGGASMMLAFLRNRVRSPTAASRRGRRPKGTPSA